VLTAVHSELESSATKVQEWLAVLPKGHIPSPAFDTTGWPLIARMTVGEREVAGREDEHVRSSESIGLRGAVQAPPRVRPLTRP
jgi:hypothetical protein